MEVFLNRLYDDVKARCFLHTRGGVSAKIKADAIVNEFSPHTWRCFYLLYYHYSCYYVFSTHVEVFLSISIDEGCAKSFLHTRGGVSCQTHPP